MNWFGLKQCFNVRKFPRNTFLKDLCKATHDSEGANEIVPPTKFNGDLRKANTFHLLPVEFTCVLDIYTVSPLYNNLLWVHQIMPIY